jgi:dihydrofolate reductase
VGAPNEDNSSVRARRGCPKRVAVALDDQHGNLDGVELREAALLGMAGRVEWEREADDGERVGLCCRAACDAGARRAPAGQDREPTERTVAQCEDDRPPSRVELVRRSWAPPPCYAVGLLHQRDAEPSGTGAIGSAEEIGRLDSAAGSMTKYEPGHRRGHRKYVRSGRSVRSVELEHPTSLPSSKRSGVAKLIYSVIASLDGYIEDKAGTFDWAAPDEEVHAFVNELERPVGTYLYGRRMYETMVFWDSRPNLADEPPVFQEFAKVWQSAEKIVYSRTLERVTGANTRLEREFDTEAVRQLKAVADRDLTVGGAELAAQAIEARLVDEYQLFLVPVVVGGGKRSLPNVSVRVDLQLLGERRFRNGTVYLRYLCR